MSALLGEKLSGVRGKLSLVNTTTGLCLAIVSIVVLLAAQMLADWAIELSWTVRALLLALDLAVLGLILVRQIIWPMAYGPSDEELALMVERAHPHFATRLIASVQLTQPGALAAGASAAIVRAMVTQTEEMAGPVEFARVVKTDRLVKLAGVSGVILILGLIGLTQAGQTGRELLGRAMLGTNPVPRQTRVEVVSGHLRIARGDGVTLTARALGVVPGSGRVDLVYESGREQQFTLERSPDDATLFTRRIDNIQESFTYVARLHDGRSLEYRVEALARPLVTSLRCTEFLPAYTRLVPRQRSTSDLSLLAGGTLKIEAVASKPLHSAQIRLHGVSGQPLATSVAGRDLMGELRIDTMQLNGFSIHLVDADGIASRDEAVYRIDVVADKDPTITMTYPEQREELVTKTARVLMAFSAGDDFGLGKIFVRYRIDKLDGGKEQTRELDIPPDAGRQFKGRYELNLGGMTPPVPEGATVEYWIEAQDRNTQTPSDPSAGVGRAFTDRYFAKVVTREEKDADLRNRVNEYFGRLDVMTKDQETLNDLLGKIILEKPR